jgi:hypothetical protein
MMMAINLISINEAAGYMNDEYLGSNANSSSDSYSKTLTNHAETEYKFSEDRQGRPNLEL